MNVVNFSDACNDLKDVIDRVVQDVDVRVITRRDAPNAVLMSLVHYNILLETVHLPSSPANAAYLACSLSQLHAGRNQARDLVNSELVIDYDGQGTDLH